MSNTWVAINAIALSVVAGALIAGFHPAQVRRRLQAARMRKSGAERHRDAVLAFGAALTDLRVTRSGVSLGPFVKHGWKPEHCAQVHAAVDNSAAATAALIAELSTHSTALGVGPDGFLAWLRQYLPGRGTEVGKWDAIELVSTIENHHRDVAGLDPAFAAAGWRGGLGVDEIHALWATGERDPSPFLVLAALGADGAVNPGGATSRSPFGGMTSVTCPDNSTVTVS